MLTVILRNVNICSGYILMKIVSWILTISSILNLNHGLNRVIVFLFISFGDIKYHNVHQFCARLSVEKEELVIPNGSTNSMSKTGLERQGCKHCNQTYIPCKCQRQKLGQ